MAVSGLGVAYSVSGFVLLWSGVKNTSVKDTLTSFLKGTIPTANPTGGLTIGVTDNNSGNGGSASGSAGSTAAGALAASSAAADNSIASDALQYAGHPYVYGGAPGTSGKSGWDCSSFCNWVLGHDLGMKLPGSSSPGYSGTSHGPDTVSYLAWTGAKTVSNNAKDAQAGDLCVWQTHMGICIGNGNMISALNESLGTKITTISGGAPGGQILFVRRIK